MIKINEYQRDKIYEITKNMSSKIENTIKEIESTKNILSQFCEEENLETYYTWTIDERLNEAKLRLDMAQIRIDEFKSEAKSLELSIDGFYC